MLALGLMSGTSLDGVDAALVETDGEVVSGLGRRLTVPYGPERRAALRAVLGGIGDVAGVERDLTLFHAGVVRRLLAEAGLAPGAVDLIGFHGHTIVHRPEEGRTWQIGDGALLAAETGIAVVNDFRSDDVAAGGQGAPLAPAFHRALAAGLEDAAPLAVLNLGGVGNVTWLGEGEDDILAFDTGPGNALLDDWAMTHTGVPLDRDGRLALGGVADAGRVERFLAHPYFTRRPPKSLDRDDFSVWAGDLVRDLSSADGAATLAAFTVAAAVADAHWFPKPARRWLVCGGGRHNPVLMAGLARGLKAPVAPVEAAGWDGDAVEAQAFAYLAVRSARGLPLTYPGTTGVGRPLAGGHVHRL